MKHNSTYITISFIIIPLMLFACCYFTFQQVSSFNFVDKWDDGWQVLNLYTSRGINANNFVDIFTTFYSGQYSPLNQWMYAMLYEINRFDAHVFHTANLLFHIGYTGMFFFYLARILTAYSKEQKCSNIFIAGIVALFVGVHPIQVEAVAWISASKLTTCAFFFMCALNTYLSYLKQYQMRYYIVTLLLFSCAFLCKEQAILFPVFILLTEWLLQRDFSRLDNWLDKLPFVLLSCLFLYITLQSYDKSFSHIVGEEGHYVWWQRIVFMSYSLADYIQKIIIPMNLMYIYPYPMTVGDPLPIRFWLYPLVLPAVAYFIWYIRKDRIALFGVIYFILQLSFFLHIIPLPRFAITADRYVYMALPGILLPVAWYGYHWGESKRIARHSFFIILMGLIGLTGVYCYISCRYSEVWKDDTILKSKIGSILQERTVSFLTK